MKGKRLKLKDYILLGLLSVVGIVVYMLSVGIAAVAILPFGTVGYLLSNGIFGLLGGCVFLFMCSRVSAPGTMTVFTVILVLALAMIGGGYLPFVISTLLAAVLADLILFRLGYTKAAAQYIAWPLFQLGILFGTMVPVWLFSQRFADDLLARGSAQTLVEDQIRYSQGGWAVACIIFTVALSLLGVWLARRILKKYLQPNAGA